MALYSVVLNKVACMLPPAAGLAAGLAAMRKRTQRSQPMVKDGALFSRTLDAIGVRTGPMSDANPQGLLPTL